MGKTQRLKVNILGKCKFQCLNALFCFQRACCFLYHLRLGKLVHDPKKHQLIIIFFSCCPNWAQVRSHILGYIPGPIGILFAIALYIPWGGNGAIQSCTLSITVIEVGTVWWYIN